MLQILVTMVELVPTFTVDFSVNVQIIGKVKNFIDRPNIAGLAWLPALKFIETEQKG